MNLTEATMLAIQGKLKLDESKEVKKESIDVSVDDNGATIVETPEATVIVTDTQNVTEAPVEEVIVAEVPEEGETVVEIPVEGDETIIPEEIVDPEVATEEPVEEVPTIDKIVDEEDLEESKKPCETCGKDVCECEKVEESKEVVEEKLDIETGNSTFKLKLDTSKFYNIEDDKDPTIKPEYEKYGSDVDEITKKILAEIIPTLTYTDKGDICINDEKIGEYCFGYEGVVELEESTKVEENVEIEVSEDGTEVEVKTDEGENVEVIDETEEPETSDEAEETEVVEVPEEETAEEETAEEVEDEEESEFIEESFEKALTEYYKENTKSIKGYKVENITKTEEGFKIEGILTNKLDKTVKTELLATKVQEGKFYTKYEIANIKGLLESKSTTSANLVTKLTKENKLECTSITNKKLVK